MLAKLERESQQGSLVGRHWRMVATMEGWVGQRTDDVIGTTAENKQKPSFLKIVVPAY